MSAEWDRLYDAEAARIVKEFQTTGKADGLAPSYWDQDGCDKALDDIAEILATQPHADAKALVGMVCNRMTKLYNDLADFDASRVADKLQYDPESAR